MFAATLLAVALASQIRGEEAPKIEVREDPVTHEKSTTVSLGTLAEGYHYHLQMLIHRDGPKGVQPPLKPTDSILLHFAAVGDEWHFLDHRGVILADGDDTLDLGSPKHRGKTMRGGVTESVMPRIKFGDLERLAGQPVFKGKIGTQYFELKPDQHAMLREYVRRLKMGEAEFARQSRDKTQEKIKNSN